MVTAGTTYSQQQTSNNKLQTLPVMEAFYTLQGEGFHQGKAAWFIRLGGCDVGCFWCDVKESWDASVHEQKTIDEIVEEVNSEWLIVNDKSEPESYNRQSANHKPIVVITGGEPLIHNLNTLTTSLQQNGFQTHVETSGSSPLSGYWNWICVSPKKFKQPLPEVLQQASELKVIIYNHSDFLWAEKNALLTNTNCKLYLQPEWSKAASITPLIIDYIKMHPQWQLSLQVHKYLNIP